jgi:hypothetical protein
MNEGFENIIKDYSFFTDGKLVYYSNNDNTKTKTINENNDTLNNFNKMKHLLDYNPNKYINSKNSKKV